MVLEHMSIHSSLDSNDDTDSNYEQRLPSIFESKSHKGLKGSSIDGLSIDEHLQRLLLPLMAHPLMII